VTNVKRVQKALANEVDALDQQLLDWGNWDDTKDFALNRTPDYIESNLNAASITNIGLSFMRSIASKACRSGPAATMPGRGS
jgi:sensor domain CHASE-containing protein